VPPAGFEPATKSLEDPNIRPAEASTSSFGCTRDHIRPPESSWIA